LDEAKGCHDFSIATGTHIEVLEDEFHECIESERRSRWNAAGWIVDGDMGRGVKVPRCFGCKVKPDGRPEDYVRLNVTHIVIGNII
jgi:hypothetical protein